MVAQFQAVERCFDCSCWQHESLSVSGENESPDTSLSCDGWCLGWEVWYSGLGNLKAVAFHGWGALEGECRQVSFKVPQLICWKLGGPGFPWTKKMRAEEGGCEPQCPGGSCSRLPQALS